MSSIRVNVRTDLQQLCIPFIGTMTDRCCQGLRVLPNPEVLKPQIGVLLDGVLRSCLLWDCDDWIRSLAMCAYSCCQSAETINRIERFFTSTTGLRFKRRATQCAISQPEVREVSKNSDAFESPHRDQLASAISGVSSRCQGRANQSHPISHFMGIRHIQLLAAPTWDLYCATLNRKSQSPLTTLPL